MHHKRRRAKNQRGGCLFCKTHKVNGADRRSIAEKRASQEKVSGEFTDAERDQ